MDTLNNTHTSHLAEDLGQKTSNMAHALLDRVDETSKKARPYADKSGKTVQDLTQKGLDSASYVKKATVENYEKAAERINDYVKAKPIHTVALAVGIGATVAWWLGRKKKTEELH